MVPSLSLNLRFRYILRIICHIDFKRGIINFCKQRKWPVKCQHLGVAPLILPPITLLFEYPSLFHRISYLREPCCLFIRDFESGKKMNLDFLSPL